MLNKIPAKTSHIHKPPRLKRHKMFRVAVLLSCIVIIFASSVLYESKYYKIVKLAELKKEKKQHALYWDTYSKNAIVELYDGVLPKDDKKGNYGDLEFIGTNRNGSLIVRDTIMNDFYDEDVAIIYNRTFPGYYITDLKILNFGRHRGYAHSANIWHRAARVDAEVIVLAQKMIRIFVEVYGYKSPKVTSRRRVKSVKP